MKPENSPSKPLIRSCHIFITLGFLLATSPAAKAEVDFNETIRPLFNQHCVACHGGVKKASGLSFLSRSETLTKGKSGLLAVVPGEPEQSHLLERITSQDPDERMPPPDHGPALSDEEIGSLRQWIHEGAEWREHWAFTPLVRPDVPEVSHSTWPRSPIDQFIWHRLQQEGLEPNPPAGKASLLRRASFDLTGLPPTPEQLDRFLADTQTDAFATAVEDLLNAPAFGERWAAMWLDLARYSDSEGLGVDGRRETWAYRDWLIRAFNENKPYDEFVIEQLAGDQLTNPTTDQLVATAFHRQTQSNGEGGTDDEEFRVAAVIDRTNTTWEVFQGVTFGCVQCHSHPYDPIQHDEYYEFLAFFNNTADADLGDHWPILQVPLKRSDYEKEHGLRQRIQTLREELTDQNRKRVQATDWHWPAADEVQASSEGNGVRMVHTSAGAEFHAVGNIAAGTEYTFEWSLPAGLETLTALRIDMMPMDDATARHTPEWSGVISRIRLAVRHGDTGKFTPVRLAEVIGDEPDPANDPNESLRRGGAGFGAMTKIFHRRTCVVLPEEPVSLQSDSVLQLRLKHDIQALGAFPLVTQRGAFAITGDGTWLANRDTREALRSELADAEQAYGKISSTTVPVMRDRPPSLQRETRKFERGNWLDKGDLVTPEVPGFLPPLPSDAPKNRLALSHWLVRDDNPLTARVAVNRFWEQLFGYGIVVTLEDFGAAGAKPVHPELLDWLAIHFRDDLNWDIKALLRTIVLSAAYQQDARATQELHERDPQNSLLARGPRRRLKAEMVRDFALAASGLLSAEQFGPPVRPPLPDGVWKPFARDPWKTDEGADRFRRALYVYWKRSIPFPSLVTFDAPSRELCTQRRLPSNTPLQALVTLNDPVFVEAATALAERMRRHDTDLSRQLGFGYRLCTSHIPTPEQLAELERLHQQVLETSRADQPEGVDDHELAALQGVATVLLNLDESLTK